MDQGERLDWLNSGVIVAMLTAGIFLLGAALVLAEQTRLSLSWREIGASAGLNQAFDRYRYELGSAEIGAADAPVVIRTRWEGSVPPVTAVEGKKVVALRRLGKRICIGLEGDLWLVFHLMIAGRLHWRDGKPKAAAKAKRR